MTGRKFTRTDAARRLGKTLGEVEALIASGDLRLEDIAGDHEVIPEQEITRYERDHPRPTVRGGPVLDLATEDAYRMEQDT